MTTTTTLALLLLAASPSVATSETVGEADGEPAPLKVSVLESRLVASGPRPRFGAFAHRDVGPLVAWQGSNEVAPLFSDDVERPEVSRGRGSRGRSALIGAGVGALVGLAATAI
jgi:hypothetical protein